MQVCDYRYACVKDNYIVAITRLSYDENTRVFRVDRISPSARE
jgi:hypothetical protein